MAASKSNADASRRPLLKIYSSSQNESIWITIAAVLDMVDRHQHDSLLPDSHQMLACTPTAMLPKSLDGVDSEVELHIVATTGFRSVRRSSRIVLQWLTVA